uniref:general stress protein n=1 Tax=Actinotalea sp. TaxID=1872145 RepID=UPI00356AED0A
MSMNPMSRPPQVPTPPQGEQIASYATYLEAQRAVDHLSDKEFPVQHVTIVGTDLAMVERVTGRLTYSRVAIAGLASGAWFGLFVGLLLSLFSSDGSALPILPAIAIGAA